MFLAIRRNSVVLACPATLALLFCLPTGARAQDLSDVATQLRALQQQLDDQAKRIEQQQAEIDRLRHQIAAARGAADQPSTSGSEPSPPSPAVSQADALPRQPVGEEPKLARAEQPLDAVPQGQGVLTRAGQFVLEPSAQYTNSSNNRLVFRGVELIPGIQVGFIEANTANSDTLATTLSLRYGLTDYLEVEGNVPFLYRADRVGSIQQAQDTASQETFLTGHDIGDIEIGLRYQLNRPIGERPIFVGSFRIKTDTGRSPYSVAFDQSGVAQDLATGSGFWAIQPGISFLLPSEPVVIFGGANYLYQIPKSINRTVGNVVVGRVDPGGAIGGNLGFAFALNPRFSFSLGYRHSYIFSTRAEIGGSINRSDPLQVGSFTMGMSYRLTERQSLNFGLELGATKDAPNVSVVMRAPFSLN